MKRNYDDPLYEECRKRVLRRDRYRCKICGSRLRICVHHLDSWNWCYAGRYEVDNCITLCRDHHEDFHKYYGRGGNTLYQFDTYLNIYHKKTLAQILKTKKK